ncbi:UvrD-helicase domain-containing protein, partial [Candidatus Aerophobetes bacterium]|nr:UvrD-helicase domain-containing protein [Candidatus Aerophobetes bacterium]
MSVWNKKILQGLHDEQREAVTYGQGPLLIVAGAGTGKTQVITRRIAYLVSAKMAKPEEILALTFTEKAALEMEERVDVLVPYGYTEFWISTFHAFGDRILREKALEIGLSSDFQVLSTPEQVIFFREHLFDFPLSYYRPLGNPTRYIQAILNLVSRAKDEDISPENYLDYVRCLEKRAKENPEDEALQEIALKEKEIALSYEKYQELLATSGKIDFGDQINLTLKLFREHPSILKEYQRRFRYILIDEFQDTNYSQFQLVKLLAKEHRNITVVGDDDQCLPPGTLVTMKKGEKKIEEIKPGEEVITAVGKGYTTYSRVREVFKRKKKTRFLTFYTENGYRVKVTDNHKMFCFVP